MAARWSTCHPSVPPGFQGHIYENVDPSDPARPRQVGGWWLEGQFLDGGESGLPEGTSLHAPFVSGDLAYLAYGAAGLVILDIADPSAPRLLSHLPIAPPFNPVIAAHTAVPLPERGLLLLNSEAIEEGCDEPLCFAVLVDISDPASPRLLSSFPVPRPPAGADYANFCERGGRFGHNVHQGQGNPAPLQTNDLVFLTWFNGGLRVYDIRDPRLPCEIASFLPPDPLERRGVLPKTLVVQTEDVVVDARGYIYVTDKNHGLYALRLAADSQVSRWCGQGTRG
jgi:hypothetical protein